MRKREPREVQQLAQGHTTSVHNKPQGRRTGPSWLAEPARLHQGCPQGFSPWAPRARSRRSPVEAGAWMSFPGRLRTMGI